VSWIDAPGQPGDRLDRLAGGVGLRAEDAGRPRGILAGDGLDEAQVDRQRDQMLLRTVVDVALQPVALVVLRRDEPLPGQLELGRPFEKVVVPCREIGT
jgi:hypothetical protein